jgi:hypothetical protein
VTKKKRGEKEVSKREAMKRSNKVIKLKRSRGEIT